MFERDALDRIVKEAQGPHWSRANTTRAGRGKQIAKIKADGKVIDGKLSKNATQMVEQKGAKTRLRRAEKKIAGHIRASGGAGGKPFKPGVRGGGCGKR